MLHAYAICNGRLANAMPASAEGRAGIYEVLRLIGGVPLFCEAHWERMQNSARLAGYTGELPTVEMMRGLRDLAAANDVNEGNIKVVAGWQSPGEVVEWAACFIPHQYPSDMDYAKGVKLTLVHAQRTNPNAKVMDTPWRQLTDLAIRGKGAYEALLVDPGGCILEGSKSNCFFLRGGRVITPPLHQVLPGVTRAKVLEICGEQALPLDEQPVHLNELTTLEAAFITGTSPGVLPVSWIESQPFDPRHPLLCAIHAAYGEKVREYLARYAL